MIDELEYLLDGFSKVNHTRCFLHVNNLVAQTFVRQFDTPKKPKTASKDDLDDPNDMLLYKLAEDIEIEEMETHGALLKAAGQDVPDDDNNDGWIDEAAALSQAERDVLEKNLRPVRLILV